MTLAGTTRERASQAEQQPTLVRFRLGLLSGSLLLLLLPIASVAQAEAPEGVAGPSFDCSTARTPVEAVTCQSSEASSADLELYAAFSARFYSLDGPAQNAFKIDHASWLNQVPLRCGLGQTTGPFPALSDSGRCLARTFRKRAELYRAGLSNDAAQEVELSFLERSALQQRLVELGFFAGPADGLFGPKTREAIRRFQQASGFPSSNFLSAEAREHLTDRDVTGSLPDARSALLERLRLLSTGPSSVEQLRKLAEVQQEITSPRFSPRDRSELTLTLDALKQSINSRLEMDRIRQDQTRADQLLRQREESIAKARQNLDLEREQQAKLIEKRLQELQSLETAVADERRRFDGQRQQQVQDYQKRIQDLQIRERDLGEEKRKLYVERGQQAQYYQKRIQEVQTQEQNLAVEKADFYTMRKKFIDEVNRRPKTAGTWNNDATGENMVINETPFGLEVMLSHLGQGSVAVTSRKGANMELSTRDVTCLYFATFTQDGKMNWQLRDGPGDRCLHGQFTRVPTTAMSTLQ